MILMNRLVVFGLSFVFLAACTRFQSPSASDPLIPPQKVSSACNEVKASVESILVGDKSIWYTDILFLHDGSCGVSVTFHYAMEGLLALQKIRQGVGAYTNIFKRNEKGEEELVTIWFKEPSQMWVPVLDENGNRLDDTETIQECRLAAEQLQNSFSRSIATVREVPHHGHSSLHCYVDLEFKTDQEFEAFFKWRNPYSFDGNLLQAHFRRSTGVVATVLVRPLQTGP